MAVMETRRADAGLGVDDLDNDAIVAELFDALDRATLLAPITARVPDFGVAAAYEVSAEILRRRRARGERPQARVHQPLDLDRIWRRLPNLGTRLRQYRHLP
jgi:hypothetical protein